MRVLPSWPGLAQQGRAHTGVFAGAVPGGSGDSVDLYEKAGYRSVLTGMDVSAHAPAVEAYATRRIIPWDALRN